MSPARNADDQLVTLAHTPWKSPAEELPVELISSIASFLVGSEHNTSRKPTSLRNLVSATHVCHRWREAISNDPRLWTDIKLSVTSHAPEVLATVLSRSGNLTLKLSADFKETVYPALSEILDVSARCDSLTLILPYELCRELFMHARPFPKLRRLSLQPFPDRSDNVRATYGHQLCDCFPALEELTLECNETEWMTPLFSAHCSCLETVVLKIGGDADDLFFDFIDMLGRSETITSVTFHATSWDVDWDNLFDDETDGEEMVVNEKIETLCLKGYGVRLLGYVSCPALRTLSVDTLRWYSHDDVGEITENVMQCIVDFLDQANAPLEDITLCADEFPVSILPLVLRAVPDLKALSLRTHLFSNLSFLTEFFDELSKKCGGGFEVVPVLEKLSIALPLCSCSEVDKFVEEIDGEHFVDMILDRTGESCLRSVSVKVGRGGRCDIDDEDISELEECQRRVDGLEIDIRDANGIAVSSYWWL